jgi:hypothetical protein
MTHLSLLVKQPSTSSNTEMLKTILESLNTQSHRKTVALVEALIEQEKHEKVCH